MTEEEAKTKWCPMARTVKAKESVVDNGQTAFNRMEGENGEVGFPLGASCIASACMAWEWGDAQKTSGSCGLAGKP